LHTSATKEWVRSNQESVGLLARKSFEGGVDRQIKALPGLAAIPIIAVSSFAMKGDEKKARAARCDDYVTKPYSPAPLLRTIRGFLGEKA